MARSPADSQMAIDSVQCRMFTGSIFRFRAPKIWWSHDMLYSQSHFLPSIHRILLMWMLSLTKCYMYFWLTPSRKMDVLCCSTLSDMLVKCLCFPFILLLNHYTKIIVRKVGCNVPAWSLIRKPLWADTSHIPIYNQLNNAPNLTLTILQESNNTYSFETMKSQ